MHALRRRLAVEDGMSLVEMIVAIFVLTVAVFALLGSMIAVAQSTHEQRMRSSATRVANATMESLRAVGFENLEDTDDPVETTETTPDGRTFTVSQSVRTVSAIDPGEDGDDVKEIEVVVSWVTRTGTKQATYSSLVAPLEQRPTEGGRISANLSPNPANVGREDQGAFWGFLQSQVEIVAIFDYALPTPPTVSWTDEAGGVKEIVLSPPHVELDATLYTATFPSYPTCSSPSQNGCLYYPIDEDDEDDPREITFVVTGGNLSTTTTLSLQPLPDNPPAFSTPTTVTSSTGGPITVRRETGHKCRQDQHCTLHNPVDVVATLTPGTMEPEGRVTLRYQVRDNGTVEYRELPLDRVSPTQSTWTGTIQASEKVRPGTSMPFEFVAVRINADGSEVATTTVVHVTVTEGN